MAEDRKRCAIYTRKSTEEGLEQAFNSLNAQREACAAYILSQRHEGWVEIREPYDDGGFSGGNMERPGLKRLLADVDAGKIDVIVVYKVDRLTRALSDFARIVDVLDKRGASFVSVTQAFNTTTSMGRLTLNVLLSFAQFEREVTGERIRDKVDISKRKGMWMGGSIPLGYRVEDRKLIIVPEEAATVRHIFTRYLALHSGSALIEELRRDGYLTRPRKWKDRMIGGIPFERGMLFHILGNVLYIGKVAHRGEVYDGQHDAIIDQSLWDAVRAAIASQRVATTIRGKRTTVSLLAGVIRDGLGRKMSPSHAVKGGTRYRYYVTHGAELRDGSPPAWRLPALALEQAVVGRIGDLLCDRTAISRLLATSDAATPAAAIAAAASTAEQLEATPHKRRIVGTILSDIQAGEQQLVVTIDRTALGQILGHGLTDLGQPLVLTTPAVKVRQGKATKLVLSNDIGAAVARDENLISLLAEARHAYRAMVASPELSLKTIAAAQRKCRHRYAKLVRLAFLSPAIVTAIAEGRHPRALTARQLLEVDLPTDWRDQARALRFA